MVSVDPDYSSAETKAYRKGLTTEDDTIKYRRLEDGDSGWEYIYENVLTGNHKKELDADDVLVIDNFKETKQFFFGGVIPFLFVVAFNIIVIAMHFAKGWF
jgi:hypothetical protein